jgi:hypothetical protein
MDKWDTYFRNFAAKKSGILLSKYAQTVIRVYYMSLEKTVFEP